MLRIRGSTVPWRLSSLLGARTLSAALQVINPLDLKEDHVSSVYCLPNKEARSVFTHGLPRKFAQQTDSVGQVCWVLRKQSYEIMTRLRNSSKDNLKECRFLLWGGDGCGKTLCLLQVVHHCVKDGWTVIHVPDVFTWTHSRRELRPSTKHPETFDQPEEASTWLKNFKTANSTLLQQLTLSEDHRWTKREKSTAGESLEKVIEQGLLKPNIATDIVKVILSELTRAHGQHKILLAVDAYNGCFNPTSVKADGRWVEPEQLNLVRHVRELTEPGKFPGALLLALSRTGMRRHSAANHTPELLLGDKGAMVRDSCQELEVPKYDRREMEACLDCYTQQKWFKKGSPPTVVDELWHLCAGNPQEFSRLCQSV